MIEASDTLFACFSSVRFFLATTPDLRPADGPHILAKRVRAIVGDRLDILVANAGISKAASIEHRQQLLHQCRHPRLLRAPHLARQAS